MTQLIETPQYTLYQGDCLDYMRGMEAGSVDAVVTDPPYFQVVNQDWDNLWSSLNDYTAWIDTCGIEWKRILKTNSSLFLFGDDKTTAYIQVVLDRRFLLLNNIVWYKPNNLPQKNSEYLRTFAPMTERALFYTTQYDATGWETVKLDINNFISLRDYFREYQEALGLNIKQINAALGHRKAEHAFYWNSTQWDLPTPETYAELEKLPIRNEFLRRDYEFLRRDYEDLRRDYEDLRRDYEDLRRPFNADKNTFDVITYPIVNGNDNTEHPTTKPMGLMRRITSVITNPNQIVMDCFMGSGTTGVACAQLGRRFIGCEIDPGYFEIARKRIETAYRQTLLPLEGV